MKTSEPDLCCSLSSPELQSRKNTILAALKQEILEKQEIADGFVYSFTGSDEILNQLISFIQSERVCCPFFRFELIIQHVNTNVRLKITGPEGAKYFIIHELNL